MSRIFNMALMAMLFAVFPATAHADLTALEIMQKVEDRDDGDNATFEMEMILIDKNQNQRLRKMRRFIKDKGKDTQSIMFFTEPADVKDTGFLTYDYDDYDKDDDQWLYLPALKKTKRIASSDKSGSFMGSDLSYSDMTSRNLEDYRFKILKEGKVRKRDVWIIEATPNKRAQDETGYEKSILFVGKDNFVVVRAKHWVKDGKKNKYFDVKVLKLIDNIWVSIETEVTTKKGKTTLHKTILRNNDTKFNQNLDEEVFSIRRLEKGL